MKRVAIIGSGISGLAAAYFLSRRHEVHLFESDRRLGGHTHTITVDSSQGPVAVDTGFLVHNDRTYPRLIRLFAELGVATGASDMCFGVTCRRTGLEYSSRGARGFFAQRRNLVRRSHLTLLTDIVRFNRLAPAVLNAPDADGWTMGDVLDAGRFNESFAHQYLFPLAAAIWSATPDSIRQFPAITMIRFMDNHGMLRLTRQPQWKVVRGGSHTYVDKLTAPLNGRVHTGVPVQSVARGEQDVTVTFTDRPSRRFDDVVFACHGDQVLPLLADATDAERGVFESFRSTRNDVWLHTDDRLLPRRPWARASWNYLLSDRADAMPTVTYHLNRLQSLQTREQFSVTLNPGASALEIDPARVLRRLTYEHPLYTRHAVRAQARWHEVSGVKRTHYCGAYWFYGFHEDGLRSALRVSEALGVQW